MELRAYINVIWKRKLIIGLCLVVAAALGVIINYGFLQTIFQATAKVLVEPRAKLIVFMSEQPRNMPPALDIETYVKMIKSLKVGEMAARRLNMPEPKKAAVGLSGRIKVESEEETGIIKISVQGSNPQDCTNVANAFAEAFVDISKQMAESSIAEVESYIKTQLQIAKQKEKEHAQSISMFKAREGVIDPAEEAARQSEMIRLLEQDRMAAQISAKETEVRLAGFKEMLAEYDDVLGSGTKANPGWDSLDLSSAQNIDDQVLELELQRSALLGKYVETHPKIKDLDERIRMLRDQKKKSVAEIVQGRKISRDRYLTVRQNIEELELDDALARTKVSRIDEGISTAREIKKKFPQQEYELNKLTREHEVAQALVDMLNKQLLETEVQKAQKPTKVQVLDEAIVPTEPILPKRKKNVTIWMILGFIVGIGAAFLLEEMEESVRTSDDVKNYLNLPVLGSIPYSAETINKLITDVPLKSPIAEAYRRLSFFTQLFCLDPPIKSLLITSSKSDEGKSTTLANMAISMAQEGTKVLIVDTDLRRPMLHRMFGIDNSLGLSSLLSGELEAEIAVSDMAASGRLPRESFMELIVDRIIQPSSYKGLSIVPSGPLPANSIELLRGERMLSFLRIAEKKADLVLFDSPPAIHVIDAVVLSQILDGVLLIINSGRINREEALQVKYMIESTKTPIIGVALNNIEAASPDYYYYYYYGGYGYGSRQRRKRVKLKR